MAANNSSHRPPPPASNPLSASSSSTIPPAPPLPPQRAPPPPTARSAFARFVTQSFTTYGSRPASAQANRGESGRPSLFPSRISGINPLASQNSSLTTRGGAEIAALDANYERTHVVIAGREVLQTIRVSGTTFTEERNIRTAILNRDSQNLPRHRESLDIHDVKWSHGQFDRYIAAAATNGKVAIYDLDRPGIEVARLHEHHRQVHRVAFNPFQGHLLLSGSQDGTVRLWDLRDMRSDVMTCRSRSRFMGQNDAVRDLRWSPKDGFEFAFGTDSGVIQKWDYRHYKSSKLRINAHDKSCTAIDWHPDGKHLLSASLDKTVKVWDFSSEVRRPKPPWFFRTPYPILNARWRLPFWTNESPGRGSWQCTQVATSYERIHPPVHIWDFRRPFMPFRELDNWTTAPTDMLWHSPDLIWSVSREGTFYQTDIQYAPKVIDRRPMQALAISSTGEIAVFSQKRGKRRHSDLDYVQDDGADKKGAHNFPNKASLARSSFDDSIDESFLSSWPRRHHGRTTSNRSAKSLSSTPPSVHEVGVALLDDTLNKPQRPVRPNQVAYCGMLDGTLNSLHFVYLAQKYKPSIYKAAPSVFGLLDCRRTFEQNALYAQKTGAYRQAQTWRMFGLVVSSLVMRSATEAWDELEEKLSREGTRNVEKGQRQVDERLEQRSEDRASTPVHPALRAIQGGEPHGGERTPESTSNVATPLARPQRNMLSSATGKHIELPNPDNDEQINLPPSVVSQHQLEKAGQSMDSPSSRGTSQISQNKPVFDGPHWLSSATSLEEHKAAMGNWRPPPREPLDFASPQQRASAAINIPPSLDRHNSDESFGLFSQSSGSQKALSLAASFSSRRSYSNDMGEIPEEHEQVGRSVREFSQLDRPAPGFSDYHLSFDSQSGTTISYPTNSSIAVSDMIASGTIIPDEDTLPYDKRKSSLNLTNLHVDGLTPSAVHLMEYFRNQTKQSERPKPKKPLWLTQPIWDLSVPEMVEHTLSYYTTEVPDAEFCSAALLLLESIFKPCEGKMFPALFGYIRQRDIIRTSELKVQSIFETYLDLLHAHSLFSVAAKARNAITELDHQPTATVRNACETCGTLIPEPPLPPICTSCKARRMPCSICWSEAPAVKAEKKPHRKSYLPDAAGYIDSVNKTGLWLFCTACGHGTHFSCRQMLLEACPGSAGRECSAEHCACPCLFPAVLGQSGRVRPEVVSGEDDRRAKESRAVKGARGILEKEKKVEFAGIG